MAESTWPPIYRRPLGYVSNLESRSLDEVELIVIHCTELPDLATARRYAERIHYPASHTGNAGHLYVDRDGAVHSWVPLERVAHHVRGHNRRSVGIELLNLGRYPNWLDSRNQRMTEAYPREQVDALGILVKELAPRLPGLRGLAGHEDLDRETVPASDRPAVRVRRKLDPGPLFPWDEVIAATGLPRLDPDAGGSFEGTQT